MRGAGARRIGRTAGLAVIAAGVGLLSGGPALADWLVTTDGAAVETRGGWEVKGRLVLFHTAAGVFSSMRLDTVDLEASAARTEAAAASAAESARRRRPQPDSSPPRKATFVLTDEDVGHVDPATLPGMESSSMPGEEIPSEAPPGELATADENPLEVVAWDAVVGANSDGVAITGVIRNPSRLHAADVKITVTILNLAGEFIAEGAGSMEVTALGPGDQAAFRAFFSGVYSVGNALFEITSFNAVLPEQTENSGDQAAGF